MTWSQLDGMVTKQMLAITTNRNEVKTVPNEGERKKKEKKNYYQI